MAHALALVTAAATLLLIVVGGLVTNSGSALAVPDWPTTFGHNMVLFPWSAMVGGILYEHSHRLLGATVGLVTLATAAALWGRRGARRWLGVAAVVLVLAQGTIGGLRVVLRMNGLAMVHGPLAQAFFGLVVVLVTLTAPASPASTPGGVVVHRSLALAGVALVYAQIVAGALLTHAAWLWPHVALAAAVFAVLPIVSARARHARHAGDALSVSAGRVLLAALGCQLLLGAGAFVARFTPVAIPGGEVSVLLLPVVHRATASIILGAAIVIAVRGLAAPSPGVLPAPDAAAPAVAS